MMGEDRVSLSPNRRGLTHVMCLAQVSARTAVGTAGGWADVIALNKEVSGVTEGCQRYRVIEYLRGNRLLDPPYFSGIQLIMTTLVCPCVCAGSLGMSSAGTRHSMAP